MKVPQVYSSKGCKVMGRQKLGKVVKIHEGHCIWQDLSFLRLDIFQASKQKEWEFQNPWIFT